MPRDEWKRETQRILGRRVRDGLAAYQAKEGGLITEGPQEEPKPPRRKRRSRKTQRQRQLQRQDPCQRKPSQLRSAIGESLAGQLGRDRVDALSNRSHQEIADILIPKLLDENESTRRAAASGLKRLPSGKLAEFVSAYAALHGGKSTRERLERELG